MGRFFNREAGIVAISIFVVAIGVALLAEARPWVVAASAVAAVGLVHWPMTLWFQDWIITYYVEKKDYDNAVRLGLTVRDSAMTRSERVKATIDLALVHIARFDYENAAANLRRVVPAQLKPVIKAVVDGNLGYCLAHLDRDLDQAEEYIQAAIKNAPQEPLFTYFLGLVRMKQARPAEARDLIADSLKREPDTDLPCPGERAWAMAQVLKALGDAPAARAELEKAKTKGSRFGELAAKELAAA